MKTVKWGIAGPGIIAHKFAEAVSRVEGAELVAVASRSCGKGEAFAKEFGIPKVFDSYSDLALSDAVDAVYVSTAHPFHKECAEVFLKAGKHVLCEKPLCVDAESGKALKKAAEDNNVFLMEAMWTAFLPAISRLKAMLNEGVIGDITGLSADFCYAIEREEDPKLFEKSLAGGSLLDVGVYCIYFARSILGDPVEVKAVSNLVDGVDLHTAVTMKHKNGGLSVLSSAIKTEKPFDARIYGTKGCVYLPDFYKADKLTVTLSDGSRREYSFLYGDNGFEFEIAEVCRCISLGMTQSDIHPLSDSIAVLEIMDDVRAQVGLTF